MARMANTEPKVKWLLKNGVTMTISFAIPLRAVNANGWVYAGSPQGVFGVVGNAKVMSPDGKVVGEIAVRTAPSGAVQLYDNAGVLADAALVDREDIPATPTQSSAPTVDLMSKFRQAAQVAQSRPKMGRPPKEKRKA